MKCLYNHYLANTAYFSAITVKNVYGSFTYTMATKASWHRNHFTVTLCKLIESCFSANRVIQHVIIIIIIIYLLKSTEQEDAHMINTRTRAGQERHRKLSLTFCP